MPRFRTVTLVAMLLTLSACRAPTPGPTPTLTPTATPIPTPTITPTPTRVPNCPAPDPNATWIAPVDYGGYPEAIGAYLDAGGRADALYTILANASSIDARFGGVWPFDLTGDGDPETIVSLFDPASRPIDAVPNGMLLVYGCVARTTPLLYREESRPLLQVRRIADFIAAGRGAQVATVRSECGARTCFDTLDVLAWDGSHLTSVMGGRLQLPDPKLSFVNTDGDAAQEIEAVSGSIASIGAGPQRALTQTWDWNGAQYVMVAESQSPPEYRIHLVHDADDALLRGDYGLAIDLYLRVVTDDALRDWQTESEVPKAQDRANLSAYALYRIMLAHVQLGDVPAAQAAFERLRAEHTPDAPGSAYFELAQIMWSAFQEAGSLSAACRAANRHANDNTDAIDGLNAFGYANREYVAADMCPFAGP